VSSTRVVNYSDDVTTTVVGTATTGCGKSKATVSHSLCFGTGEVPSAVSPPRTNQSVQGPDFDLREPDFYLDNQLPVGMYVSLRIIVRSRA
jgi:hypothetical protein